MITEDRLIKHNYTRHRYQKGTYLRWKLKRQQNLTEEELSDHGENIKSLYNHIEAQVPIIITIKQRGQIIK